MKRSLVDSPGFRIRQMWVEITAAALPGFGNLFKMGVEPGVAAQIYNPSSPEAKAGG
jgi:hypothetical protein